MELNHSTSKAVTPSANSAFLPLIVTVLAFTYYTLLTILVSHIPDDAFAAGMSAYALIGAIISTTGFVGVTQKRHQLISLFAAFLLVDALVAVVCRLAVLWVIMNTMFAEIWQICMATAPYGFQGWEVMEVIPRHDVVTSARWQREHVGQGRKQCGWMLNTIQLLMMAIVIGVTMLQATLAMGVRRHGKQIERWGQEHHLQSEGLILEKVRPECA